MTPNPFIRDPQLGLFEAKPADANVVWLESFLKAHADWITAARILTWHGRADSESEKRTIRALAEASPWIISGQFGYKHVDHATADEIAHCANNLISQGKKMIKRALAIRRNAHKRFS